jgi:hypothetical protein
LNCDLDAAIVAEFDALYGVDARRVLRAADRGKKKHGKHKKRKRSGTPADEPRKAPRRPPAGDGEPDTRAPAPAAPSPQPSPTTTTTTPTTTETTPAPAPAPAPHTCTKLERLLGCRD